MTEQQFREKTRELYEERGQELFNQCVDRALNSGAMDLNEFKDDFILPRIFMHAYAIELQEQWNLRTKYHQKYAKNLALFL